MEVSLIITQKRKKDLENKLFFLFIFNILSRSQIQNYLQRIDPTSKVTANQHFILFVSPLTRFIASSVNERPLITL